MPAGDGATDALASASGSSKGVWRRTAIHAEEACRRIPAQVSDNEWLRSAAHVPANGWRRIPVHASAGVRQPRVIEAPTPATSNARATPVAIRRRPRRLGRGAGGLPGRLGATCSSGSQAAGSEGDSARAGGGSGCDMRHREQTPSSPGSDGYRAPQVEHPTTGDGVFMLRMLAPPRPRFPASRCDGAALRVIEVLTYGTSAWERDVLPTAARACFFARPERRGADVRAVRES